MTTNTTTGTAEQLEPTDAEATTTFPVRLPVTVLDHIQETAEQRNVTTAALIRRWIDAGITQDQTRDTTDSVSPVLGLLDRSGGPLVTDWAMPSAFPGT